MPEPDYFTLAELRALPRMADAATYTDERCLAAAAYIVGIIEREVGTSFVARPGTATFSGGRGPLVLPSHVLQLTSVTLSGQALDVGDVDIDGGILTRWSGDAELDWPVGRRNVTATWLAGYSAEPPPDVKEAALRGTRAHLLATNSAGGADMTDRRTSVTTEQGTVNFVVAGRDNPTGYPEVDATIVSWRNRLSGDGWA